jgi:general stress protein CsbA
MKLSRESFPFILIILFYVITSAYIAEKGKKEDVVNAKRR